MWLVWLGMFVLSLILEASTEALVSIWFAAGALVSLGCSFIPGLPYRGEVIVFFAIMNYILHLNLFIAPLYLSQNVISALVLVVHHQNYKITDCIYELFTPIANNSIQIHNVILIFY